MVSAGRQSITTQRLGGGPSRSRRPAGPAYLMRLQRLMAFLRFLAFLWPLYFFLAFLMQALRRSFGAALVAGAGCDGAEVAGGVSVVGAGAAAGGGGIFSVAVPF